ncbi:Probable conjugal transfer protein traA (plasmid) [Mesorhizobium loti]|nr:Probable conjugal transfer protein traA [Mesorhizobium loti]
MAIYSLRHQPIGKSTQARPFTSAAHVRYIMRRGAVGRIEAARMPATKGRAARFMQLGEEADRKNARVADKLLLALPRELDAEQRAQLVRDYAEDVTRGRAPWLAAFHDKGKDEQNPHVHLVVRDRDPTTGKRVAGLSENGSTERLRALWEDHANRALEGAGRAERIDRRTLKAQGIDRAPTIHEGPRAQQMDRRGVQPKSQVRNRRNAPGSRSPARAVNYPAIDEGRSRPAYNRALGTQETEASFWAAIHADKLNEEMEHLRNIHNPPASVDVQRPLGPLGARQFLALNHKFPDTTARFGALTNAALVPGEPPGLDTRQAVFKPASDEKPGREPHQNGSYPLRQEFDPSGNPRNHPQSMNEKPSSGKQKTMDDKDKLLEMHKNDLLQKQFNHDKTGSLLDSTMKRAFLDPDAAMKKMNQYAEKENSREALYDKLADKKQVFGRRPGSILSQEGYMPGAEAKRRDADIARQQLPSVLRNADRNKAELANSEKAYRDAQARYQPVGGGGGPGEGQTPQPQSPNAGGAGGGPQGGQTPPRPSPSAQPQMPKPQRPPEQSSEVPPMPGNANAPRQEARPAQHDKDQQNNDARRRMMDQMPDRRAEAPQHAPKIQPQPAGLPQQVSGGPGMPAIKKTPEQGPQPAHHDKDQQNNDARRRMMDQMRDRRAEAPQHAPKIQPQPVAQPQQASGGPGTPANTKTPEQGPQPAHHDKDKQNNDTRRQMMDQMRDRRAREKEVEKQKGKAKGVGVGE